MNPFWPFRIVFSALCAACSFAAVTVFVSMFLTLPPSFLGIYNYTVLVIVTLVLLYITVEYIFKFLCIFREILQ